MSFMPNAQGRGKPFLTTGEKGKKDDISAGEKKRISNQCSKEMKPAYKDPWK